MKSIGLFRSVTIVLSGLLLATVVASAQPPSREAVLATSPRIAIDTPRLRGSVALIGGRIDDLLLVRYRETVDPGSPVVVLLSPVGSERPYYAEFGWLAADGAEAPQPATDARWRQEGAGVLAIDRPVTLVHDDGAGLSFRRTISVDDKYLFTVTDEVHNAGTAPVTLRPYARLVRHGRPPGLGLYLAHEGLIGVLGDLGLRELTYTSLDERKQERFDVINAWLGISDQYWATALLPDPAARLDAWFAALGPPAGGYQAGYRLAPQTIPPGGSGRAQVRLFAGAKEVAVVDGYDASLHLNRFDLLIDWGWSVAFIVKPMFLTVAFLEGFVHNYGVAILLLAVLIQLLFFPLAHKSYAALAQRKAPQPSGAARPPSLIWRRLYVAAQFVIQFSLVKMLFVAVELRHAPFFGWIHDLSAPDPTNIFTLAGWLPFDPAKLPVIGPLLQLGIWPAVMCVAMWGLIRLKPAPADPTQKVVYNAAPVVVGYVFASWAAGLVLYRACNSSLALLHQGWVIRRHGGRVKLLDDVARIAARRKPAPPTGVSPTPGVRAVMRLPRRIRIVRAIRSACRGAFWVAAILLLLGPGSLDGAVTVALVLTLLLAIIATR